MPSLYICVVRHAAAYVGPYLHDEVVAIMMKEDYNSMDPFVGRRAMTCNSDKTSTREDF